MKVSIITLCSIVPLLAPFLVSAAGSSQFELVKRHACSVASDCSRVLPAFTCNAGYHFKHSKCVKSKHQAVAHHQHHHHPHHHGHHHKTPPTIPAPTPVTTHKPKPKPTSSGSAPKTPPAVAPPSSLLSSAGVNSFLGVNTGIASWFRTNSGQDSTNGHSWCGFPYDDSVPGFAPDVSKMLGNFGGNYQAAATAYCGLEADFTTPDGRTTRLVIADGFDPAWVRTPGSVDVITGSFPLLFGSQSSNKNDVVQNVKWALTGTRNEQYKFKGQGSG